MKRIKKIATTALAIITLFSTSTISLTKVKAEGAATRILTNGTTKYLAEYPKNEFQHNGAIIYELYRLESTGGAEPVFNAHNINVGTLVPLLDGRNDAHSNNFQNSEFDTNDYDIINILGMGSITNSNLKTLAETQANWYAAAYNFQYSLAKYLTEKGTQTSAEQVKVIVKSYTPVIEGINDTEITNIITTETGLTQENYNTITRQGEINHQVYEKYKDELLGVHEGNLFQELIEITAIAPNGAEYKLVNGTDKNWYLLATTPEQVTTSENSKIIFNYHTNGGTYIESTFVTFNMTSNIDHTVIALPTTTRAGFSFVNWYLDADFNSEMTYKTYRDVVTNVTPIEENGQKVYVVDLYAKWISDNTAETAKIIFNFHTNGGTEIKATSIVINVTNEINQKITLAIPEKVGYKFENWYLDVDFKYLMTYETYNDVIFNIVPVEENGQKVYTVDLYAKWIKDGDNTNTNKTSQTGNNTSSDSKYQYNGTIEAPNTGMNVLYTVPMAIVMFAVGIVLISKKNLFKRI